MQLRFWSHPKKAFQKLLQPHRFRLHDQFQILNLRHLRKWFQLQMFLLLMVTNCFKLKKIVRLHKKPSLVEIRNLATVTEILMIMVLVQTILRRIT